MSDHLLAVTLALCLALPLCLSLDSDLFANREKVHRSQPVQITQMEPLSAVSSSIEAVNRQEQEAGRRFSILAVEVMEQKAGSLDVSPVWESQRTGTDLPVIIPQPGRR